MPKTDTTIYQAKKPQPRRHFWQSLWYDHACYTPAERRIREKILILRQHSSLDASLLQTDNSWFHEDESIAYIINNQDAWFLETMYTPRTPVTRDAFHITSRSTQPVWTSLSILTRQIGDYLLLRSRDLSDAELNDPLHYFYLDIIQIINRLSQHPDSAFVAAQLPRLSQYLQQTSILTSHSDSSDQLFIDDCRIALRKVLNQEIASQLDSRQFGTILSQLQSALEYLGERHHTLLHFALVATPVNEHPYWELFAQQENQPEPLTTFPTLIGQHCLTQPHDQPPSIISILPNCPNLQFLSDTSVKQQQLYLDNLQNLQELLRFKQMLMRVQRLTEQAGELFTLHYFRQDLLGLVDQVDQFFQKAHLSALELLQENDKVYHDSIIQLQSLSWWNKIWRGREGELLTYLNNQNNLARFTINRPSLEDSLRKVTELLLRASSQLRSQQFLQQQQLRLMDVQQEAQLLLGAMYQWRLQQNERLGLPLPPQLQSLPQSEDKSRESNRAEAMPAQPLTTPSTDEPIPPQPRDKTELPGSAYQTQRTASYPPLFPPAAPLSSAPVVPPPVLPSEFHFCPNQNPNPEHGLPTTLLLLCTGLPLLLLMAVLCYKYYYPNDDHNASPEQSDSDSDHEDAGVGDCYLEYSVAATRR
ncbi:MAG: hypothetical protein JJT82_01420 [Legionellaceae bacterium]|nr:hypothetical protein [Legionellaceae bacterium]